MNPGMKMLLATSLKEDKTKERGNGYGGNTRKNMGGEYRNYPRTEYNKEYAGGNYPDANYRRYEMEHDEDDYEPEGKFRDRDGREHYDNGRYAPMRSEYTGNQGNYPMYPKMPPIYERPMNKIGFSMNGEPEQMQGGADHEEEMAMPFNQMMAEKWTRHMENEDGTKGAHWTPEQAKQVMAQRGVSADPWEFFAVLNAVYSDYSKVLKKYGVGDKLDLYVDLAKAWLDDKDSVPEKASAYFTHVVKH